MMRSSFFHRDIHKHFKKGHRLNECKARNCVQYFSKPVMFEKRDMLRKHNPWGSGILRDKFFPNEIVTNWKEY